MENLQIKLIENTYNKEEARDLLLTLIKDKIKFLKQKVFSIQERTGGDISGFQERIIELENDRDQLIKKFNDMDDTDFKFEIDCHAYLKKKKEESVFV